MSELNARQREAVQYIDGPLLVLAGAGSGKTRVITRKIAYLIERCAIAPRHISAVTFTNKAAREMRERAGALLKRRDASGLTVSTFHTLGLNILRKEHRLAGYKPGFSIFDAQDSESLLKELQRRQDTADEALGRQQWQISGWKNDLLSPEQALAGAGGGADVATARLYAEYQRSLRAYNALDFDDLIVQPVRLLREHPEALERWQGRIRYLLVDEYQDTNQGQYELVRLLVGVRGALTVVGDDDQSIYAWRGARPENLARLRVDFPRLKLIKLEQNYRSTGRILRAANRLIANNPHVFEKRLWSELGPGDPIRVIECRNEDQEAERVVSEILHQRLTRDGRWGDYAILYRGNHQSRIFEKALREQRVPYALSGGTSFFARAEIKDLMAYLRLLANPADDAAFLRIVNTPRREIGPGTLEKLGEYAGRRGAPLLQASTELGLGQVLSPRAAEHLSEFARWVDEHARAAERGDPVQTFRSLLHDIHYQDWLRESAATAKAAQRQWENCEELHRLARGPATRAAPGKAPGRDGQPSHAHEHARAARRGGRRRPGAPDDPACGQGAGVSPRLPGRGRGGSAAPPHQHRGRQYRGGAPARLRGHHPGPDQPDADPGRHPQTLRRGTRLPTEPLPGGSAAGRPAVERRRAGDAARRAPRARLGPSRPDAQPAGRRLKAAWRGRLPPGQAEASPACAGTGRTRLFALTDHVVDGRGHFVVAQIGGAALGRHHTRLALESVQGVG